MHPLRSNLNLEISEMPCFALRCFFGCSGGLVLEGVQRIFMGRGAFFGVSGCDSNVASATGW